MTIDQGPFGAGDSPEKIEKSGEGTYNPATDPDNNAERGALHRAILAEGGVTNPVKGTMALDALARGDMQLAIQLTQELEQSDDDEAVRRAKAIKEAMADLAEGKDVGENKTIKALLGVEE